VIHVHQQLKYYIIAMLPTEVFKPF